MKHIDLYIKKIEFLYENYEYKKIYIYLKIIHNLFPNNVEAYIKSAEIYIKLHNFKQADDICEKGINNFPNNAWLYIRYAESAHKSKNLKEALKRWEIVRIKFINRQHGYTQAAYIYDLRRLL